MASRNKMMYWYINKILNVYRKNKYENKSYSNTKVIPIKFKLVDIKKKHILNEAVDFHCFPNIINCIIKKTNNKFNNTYIKQIIWEYNSSTNYRKNNTKYPIGNDYIICNLANNYSKNILNNIFNKLYDTDTDTDTDTDIDTNINPNIDIDI